MLFESLHQFIRELPGCESTSVVSFESGLPLCAVTSDGSEPSGAHAFHADLYRRIYGALSELQKDDSVDGVVIGSDCHQIVSQPIGKTGYFWHVVTHRTTTLGFVQAIMRKYGEGIENAVREVAF